MSEPVDNKKHDPTEWVDEHGDALFQFALLRVKDPEVAEDLVQETFLSALKGIDRFKGRSPLRTWLVGILKHKLIDHFRKGKPEVLVGDLTMHENETEADRLDRCGAPDPHMPAWLGADKLLENKEFWDVLVKSLDSLPETHRRAFSLREIDGIKGDEICKILDITSTNLWVILHRARGKLRSCLDASWFGAK